MSTRDTHRLRILAVTEKNAIVINVYSTNPLELGEEGASVAMALFNRPYD
jgi:hypothetical protein